MTTQHKFTFPSFKDARLFVERLVLAINRRELEPVAIYIEGNEVQVLDDDHQNERLAQLARTSSVTAMQVVRRTYPSKPPA